jgi:hypothetical protein
LRPRNRLRLKVLDRVALARAGANTGADVLLAKSAKSLPSSLEGVELGGPLGRRIKDLLATAKAADRPAMMKCESCGKPSPEGAPKCPFCGAAGDKYHAREAPTTKSWEDRTWDDGFEKKDYPREIRRELAAKGFALPDGSYPIKDCGDVSDALSRFGQGKAPDAQIKAHIKKRWRALACGGNEPFYTVEKSRDRVLLLEDGRLVHIDEALNIFDELGKQMVAAEESVEKKGRKISRERLARLKAAHAGLAEVIAESEVTDEPEGGARMGDDQTHKHGLPARPEKFAEWPEDARQAYEVLEGKLQEAPVTAEKSDSEKDEAVFKGMTPEAIAIVKKAQADADEARKSAEELRVEKANGEWAQRIAKHDRLGLDAAALAPSMRTLEEKDPDLAKAVETALSAANTQVEKGALYAEIGGLTAAYGSDSPYGKLETLAKARVEAVGKTSDGSVLSFEQAMSEVLRDPANVGIVEAYHREREEAKR